jgi:hypothetical protein
MNITRKKHFCKTFNRKQTYCSGEKLQDAEEKLKMRLKPNIRYRILNSLKEENSSQKEDTENQICGEKMNVVKRIW